MYYNVRFLEDAIEQHKKVIFYYYDLDENGEKVYRHEHHHYVVEPVALIFNEDNYYLMTYSPRHDNTANYRVDRMDHVDIIEESISERALQMREGLDCCTEEQMFKFMTTGKMSENKCRKIRFWCYNVFTKFVSQKK